MSYLVEQEAGIQLGCPEDFSKRVLEELLYGLGVMAQGGVAIDQLDQAAADLAARLS